ncbi:hypothetical protein B566_EDAN004998, partial [Ephemera danica]
MTSCSNEWIIFLQMLLHRILSNISPAPREQPLNIQPQQKLSAGMKTVQMKALR